MSVETITLGCRLNFAESETIARLASAKDDWIVINSCAVTNEAVRQTRQAIRHASRRRLHVVIGVLRRSGWRLNAKMAKRPPGNL